MRNSKKRKRYKPGQTIPNSGKQSDIHDKELVLERKRSSECNSFVNHLVKQTNSIRINSQQTMHKIPLHILRNNNKGINAQNRILSPISLREMFRQGYEWPAVNKCE